jgi:tetratricopeptide (TPR) repeat protein
MSGAPPDEEARTDGVTATGPRRWNLWQRLFGATGGPDPAAGVPERIGRYRVIKLLGEGGMGRVFEAEDETLQRRVAVKVLKEWGDSSRGRFLREARAAARISHPNVCPIFDVDEQGGRPYLVTELLAGETLASRLKRGPLSVDEVLTLARDMLAALGMLHESGIVHRDVKPSNVFLTTHGAKLLDFGLARDLPKDVARALASGGDLTPSGLLIGTPGYMAPEQVLGHPVDGRADLFATGVVLYEALSGRRPFTGESLVQVASAILHEDPPTLTGQPAEAFDATLRRALAKSPGQRFASAREMADALQAAGRTVENRTARAVVPTREPFVGREAELAWLDERLAAAMAGQGSVVLVTGERGVGKTTLVGEFLRRVRSGTIAMSIAAGRCVETQGPGEAFLPFLDALGRLLTSPGRERTIELLRIHSPTICVQFRAGLLPDPDGSLRQQAVGATKERLVREAGDFIEAAAREFPAILYLEDLQWADPATVGMLHHVGCRTARQRVLIIGVFRHADVDAANAPLKRCAVDLLARGVARELAIGSLSPEDSGRYLDKRFVPNRFPDSFAGALYARTEGLALFVRSLVDLLEERGDIEREEGTWALARTVAELDLAPAKGLRDLVRQHVEALPGPRRELLQHAAVAGREFLSSVVAHTVGGDEGEVEEDLRLLCDVRRILQDRGEEELPDGTVATRYRFTHGLYQEVLYQDLVPSRRATLHRQVSLRLGHHFGDEAPRLAAEIARHAELGRDYEQAVTFRIHTGDNEARRYAYDEAAEHYDWASRLIDRLPPEGRPAHALVLRAKRGTVRHAQARFDEAIGDFEATLEIARRTGSAEAEHGALGGLCEALFFARRVDEMAVRAQEMQDAATRRGHESEVVEARSWMGQVLVCEGRLAEGIAMLDGVIEAARRLGHRKALRIGLSSRGFVHYWQTEYGPAEELMGEAAALATDRGEAFDVLLARMFVGLSRVKLGRVSEGIQEFLDGISLARRNGDRFWLPHLVGYVGWAHREVLAHERAREFDKEALRVVREASLPSPEIQILLYLASDEVQLGNRDRASELLTELEAKVAESDWFRWMEELRLGAVSAAHWLACGELDRTAEHAGRLLGLARRLGARDYHCAAERCRAEVALAQGRDLEKAARRLSEALEGLRDHPALLEGWRSARVLGLLYRRLGDEAAAAGAFAEAAEAIRTIATGIADETLRAGFLGAEPVREVLEAAPEP